MSESVYVCEYVRVHIYETLCVGMNVCVMMYMVGFVFEYMIKRRFVYFCLSICLFMSVCLKVCMCL